MLRLTFLEAKNYLTLPTPSPVSKFLKANIILRKKLRGSYSIVSQKRTQTQLLLVIQTWSQKIPMILNLRVMPLPWTRLTLGTLKQVWLCTVRPASSSQPVWVFSNLPGMVKHVPQHNCHAVRPHQACM